MYTIRDRCEDCYNWSDEKWHRVGEYLAKLSVQREQKRAKAVSSSFSGFSPSMPMPLCQLTFPYDTILITAVVSSSACVVTFSVAAPVVSAAPFAPPNGVVLSSPVIDDVGRVPLR